MTKWRTSLYNNGLVFLLCGEICFYKSFRTAAVEGKSLKETALLISTLTTLECFYGFFWHFVYWESDSSLQKPKEGRETVENHLIHTSCTTLYRHTHIMTSILVDFFAVFIFVEAGLSTKITTVCTQRKNPAMRYQFEGQSVKCCSASHKQCL